MAHEHTATQRAAQAAIDEAAHTVAESSRRAAEQAQHATRTLLDQSVELNRTLFGAWVGTGEVLGRAAFELQNAQLRAGLSWWQTLADSSRATGELLQQWAEVAHQAQGAWLELYQASARTLANGFDRSAASAERTARSSR
jgi:hypothetical protein